MVLRKQSVFIQFITVYSVGMMIVSFIALQARWDQPRIILVCMPVLLILLYLLFYNTVHKSGMGQFIYLIIIGLLSSSIIISTFKRAKVNIPIATKNLKEIFTKDIHPIGKTF